MVHKCGYLPLVISLLGGVLSNTKSMRDWEDVNDDINVYLYDVGDTEKETEIHGVLNLSYEDLPYYLKPCFLIMGLFKGQQAIQVDDLYTMWIAQGMISHDNRRNEESSWDIAEIYLSELVSRCIVQVHFEEFSPRFKYTKCKLYDVVWELCLSMGKNEDFGVEIFYYQGGKFSTLLCESLSSGKTRHLAICFEGDMEEEMNDEITTIDEDKSKHVRSLMFLNHANRKISIEVVHMTIAGFQKLKFLRFLYVLGFDFGGRKLLKGIGNLILLRSLSLIKCVGLSELPSSISNLAYLDSLIFYFSWNIQVPNVMKKLSRLKRLHLPYYDKELAGNYRLSLDEGLEQLESLLWFNSLVHELKSFSRMKNLQHFIALVHDNESLSTIVNAISTNWKNLRYSAIYIMQSCEFIGGEKGLMDLKNMLACTNLDVLVIEGARLGRVLEECETKIITSRILWLMLHECEIEVDPMRILGMMPILKHMTLSSRSFVGEQMTCHALSFPHLKELTLEGLPNLRQWRVEKVAMPTIYFVLIKDCPCLEMIPDGFKFIVTLLELQIIGMPELQERVSEGGEDFDKVRHIPSIIINN